MDLNNFRKWFDGRKFELERLYRGTVDGFDSTSFRGKVHSREGIIMVIESELGKKFGGYTSLAINQSSSDSWYTDTKAFIFSLTHQTKHPII